MKLKYNAPVALTFALAAVCVLAGDLFLVPGLIEGLFTASGTETFQRGDFPAYVRLFTYVLGHRDWDHLLGNMTLVLLLGPVLEEKHGSRSLLGMLFITALVNGLINAFFFPTDLTGASGIVFMMILLISFANIRKGEIPLTLILIIVLYLSKELLEAIRGDDISQISHLVGGACGCIFGFVKTVRNKKKMGTPPFPGALPAYPIDRTASIDQ